MLIDILGMTEGTFVIMAIIIAIVFFAIWYNIIRSASKSYAVIQLQKIQIKLLKEIALKNGVEEKKVEEIYKESHSY
jgi:hypothetical protein